MASKKLNKKQNNQATVKALETAAKQIASEGVEALPAGSYPFDIEANIVGELLVKQGSAAGEEVTAIDFSVNDVLRGIMATSPTAATLVSDALAWHKKASKDDKKAQDAKTSSTLLTAAKRRKMTKVHSSPARAGGVSAKPAVEISGSVSSRDIKVGVKAS